MYLTNRNRRGIHIYNGKPVTNVSYDRPGAIVYFDLQHGALGAHLYGVIHVPQLTNEPPNEKTNNLHMRKQRRRSASR